MRVFGFEITRAKALPVFSSTPDGGWYPIIREPWAGAWQSNIVLDSTKDLLGFSAVFACITVIASDIAKLRIKLIRDNDGIWEEVERGSTAFLPVLRKPNNFQTRIQFVEQWLISKLLYGNTYVLKSYDSRRVVNEMFVLHPQKVKPLITEDGDVYYQISKDDINNVKIESIVPASAMIHDRMNCLFHPLIGVSPLYAAAMSATMGNKIQNNSSVFFKNMSRPSGMLTAPGDIPADTAARLKKEFEENYGGQNIGRMAVAGSGLTFTAFNMPAEQSQLIEQLKWTVDDVARTFHVPSFKIGGPVPPYNTVEALNQVYYSDCLQGLIESLELCLDHGLSLPNDLGVECDLDGLLRMDHKAQAETDEIKTRSGILAPNEARKKYSLKPVKGGDSPYLQQQNYSLEALAKRDAQEDPFGTAKPEAKPEPEVAPEDEGATEDDEMKSALVVFQTSRKFERAMYGLS